MIGQLTATEMFVMILGAIVTFAFQMFGAWLLWGMKQKEKSREDELKKIVKAADCLRDEVAKLNDNQIELEKRHNDVVLYLKMKNGDIAREVL